MKHCDKKKCDLRILNTHICMYSYVHNYTWMCWVSLESLTITSHYFSSGWPSTKIVHLIRSLLDLFSIHILYTYTRINEICHFGYLGRNFSKIISTRINFEILISSNWISSNSYSCFSASVFYHSFSFFFTVHERRKKEITCIHIRDIHMWRI